MVTTQPVFEYKLAYNEQVPGDHLSTKGIDQRPSKKADLGTKWQPE